MKGRVALGVLGGGAIGFAVRAVVYLLLNPVLAEPVEDAEVITPRLTCAR